MLVIVTNGSAIYVTHMFPTHANYIFHECYLNSLLGRFQEVHIEIDDIEGNKDEISVICWIVFVTFGP